MRRAWRSQPAWILFAAILGALIGWLRPAWAAALVPLEALFLRLIMMLIGPLLFALLSAGLARHAGRGLGRVALKTLLLFELLSTLALLWGWLAASVLPSRVPSSLIQVRARTTIPTRPGPAAASAVRGLSPAWAWTRLIVPSSFTAALAHNHLLQIVFFSLLFGLAMGGVGERARPVLAFCEALGKIMLRLTQYVMWLAPAAVLAAVAWSVAHPGTMAGLARFLLSVYAALALFALIVFGALIALARLPLGRFWRAVREPLLVGFATASSEAALPLALANLERMGVPDEIAALVLPAGYSFNLTGTCVYLPAAMLFLAHAGGIVLPPARQWEMLFTLMLASKGLAGVPRAVFVILAALAAPLGLPTTGIVLLLMVDPFLDMARTAVNVLGNCLAAAAVAQWEHRLPAAHPPMQAAAE